MTVTYRVINSTPEPSTRGVTADADAPPVPQGRPDSDRDGRLSPHRSEALRVVDPGLPHGPAAPNMFGPQTGSVRVRAVTKEAAAYDAEELIRWYRGDAARGRDVTAGDTTRGIPGRRNALPVQRGDDWRVIINFGAGAKGKVPFQFTPAHLERARAAADEAQRAAGLHADDAHTERVRLSAAVVAMENIVHAELLSRMGAADRETYWAGDGPFATPSSGAAVDLDCVDQASNVTSYLVVLAHAGELRHHRIIHPGLIHLGAQPHYFGQLEERGGPRFRFDMYHRGRFGVPPFVEPQ